jgi:carboxypeptidase C (cathepsin A)
MSTALLGGIALCAQTPAVKPASEPDKRPMAVPADSTTEASVTVGGKTIAYKTVAGILTVGSSDTLDAQIALDGKWLPDSGYESTKAEDAPAVARIFYTAYFAKEPTASPSTRPIVFFYNGGPGSATMYLRMASLGPVRLLTPDTQHQVGGPYKIVPNEFSLLDVADIVFIDAPGTGYSRVLGRDAMKSFYGIDQDAGAFDRFIRRFLTKFDRWESPKFLFGESYGTPRSAALVAALNNDGMEFNGVTLLSSILNYYMRAPGYDLEPKTYFPTYASIAWYYNKVPHTGTQMEWIEKARQFARGPYMEALDKGDLLPKAEFDAMAAKVAAFTGLPLEYVKESKLRISPSRFRKELLRNDAAILGRYDARFQGEDMDSAGEMPGYDPSDTGISGVYVGAFHDYIVSELKYQTNEDYNLSGPGINQNWDWTHRASGAGGYGGGRGTPEPDTVLDLSDAMRKNPKLHVFSANGVYDLATPFFGTEHDLAQMMLPEPLTHNVQFGYYQAGHMVYLNVDALKEMHADLEKFYAANSHH